MQIREEAEKLFKKEIIKHFREHEPEIYESASRQEAVKQTLDTFKKLLSKLPGHYKLSEQLLILSHILKDEN